MAKKLANTLFHSNVAMVTKGGVWRHCEESVSQGRDQVRHEMCDGACGP